MDQADDVLYKSNMRRDRGKTAILSYNLFGEVRDLPDVVHCETLAARSVPFDWEFSPHRHGRLHQILLISRGGGRATMEGRDFRLKAMTAVNVPAGHVHGYRFTKGTKGWVMTIPTEILDEVLKAPDGLSRTLSEAAQLRGTPAMRRLMQEIAAEYNGRRFARAHVLKALSATLLGLVARELAAQTPPAASGPGAGLIDRFGALIDDHFREHWPVARYAAALKVTPTHLSRLTREAFGCPASHMIRDRVVREARRQLVYTGASVSNIAYALGFNDPAYFSRTFAVATGLSPSKFRERVHGGP